MNKLDVEHLRLLEDEDMMEKYIELKAAILEETRNRNSLLSEETGYIRESYSPSYLSYYGVA